MSAELLDQLRQLVKDADAGRTAREIPTVQLLYGWDKEQWAWTIYWHTMHCKPFDARTLTIEQALDIQVAWRNAFPAEPPNWASQLFSRFELRNKWMRA